MRPTQASSGLLFVLQVALSAVTQSGQAVSHDGQSSTDSCISTITQEALTATVTLPAEVYTLLPPSIDTNDQQSTAKSLDPADSIKTHGTTLMTVVSSNSAQTNSTSQISHDASVVLSSSAPSSAEAGASNDVADSSQSTRPPSEGSSDADESMPTSATSSPRQPGPVTLGR